MLLKPRMIEMPDGQLLTRRAVRTLENIEADRRRIAADRARAAAELSARRATEAYEAEKADRAAARAAETASAMQQAARDRMAAIRARLANDRPLLAAIVIAGLCLVVAFAGQVMVYKDLHWHGFDWLAYLLPVIVEGATWTFAIFAAWLAERPGNLAYAKYVRWMWAFAAYAAGSNAWHFARGLSDLVTGVLLGGASIVGPFVWHSYLSLRKTARSGRTGDQIRAAILRRIHYPLISLRAQAVWAAAGGALATDEAWLRVYVARRGHRPGADLALTQHPASALNDDATQRSLSADNDAEMTADSALDPAPNTSAETPLIDPALSVQSAALMALIDDVESAFPQRSNGTADVALSGARSGTSDTESGADSAPRLSADPSAEDTAEMVSVQRSVQRRLSARRQRSTQRQMDGRSAVRDWVTQRLADGADLSAIRAPEVAAATGMRNSTARNHLAKVRAEIEAGERS